MELMTSRWTDDRMEGVRAFREMVIGLHATLTRFSLELAGAVIVAVVAALMAS